MKEVDEAMYNVENYKLYICRYMQKNRSSTITETG